MDGATKELCFFGGRVGFVTFGASGEVAAALDTKIKGMARANVSTAPAISQALVLSALQNPELPAQQAERLDESIARYRRLKSALDKTQLTVVPFNSGFFALIPVEGDPEDLRQRLLKRGVGVVSLPKYNSIRVAFSSTSLADIDRLVEAIAAELEENA